MPRPVRTIPASSAGRRDGATLPQPAAPAAPASNTPAVPTTSAVPNGQAAHNAQNVPAALAPPRPAARRPGLIPTDIADALSAVLSKATTAIRTHEAGSRTGGDMENVHQMRVATRRIRAYLKAAQPALDRAAADGLRSDLAELAGALGAVRDLDVMIDRLHTEAAALGEPDAAALEVLIDGLDDERVVARARLVRQLEDPAYQLLLVELEAAASKPPVADPWADLAALGKAEFDKLAKGQRRLEQFGDNPPDDDLHALRILGKRARYAAELQEKSSETTVFLQALAQFQEILGDHQDASVLEEQLRAMVSASADPAAAIAAGRIIEGGRRRKLAARQAYPAAWAAVAKAARAAYRA